jgi:predicted house-cleaning noncanonical NTP pyrophosphatase (MazG superfamily)
MENDMPPMRRFRVEKLIRDRLPEIMREQGLAVFERQLAPDERISCLKAKLLEEAGEAAAAGDRADMLNELADVSEVILALAAAYAFSAAEIEAARLAKRAERGGFDAGVFNAAVEAPDGHPALDYYLARPEAYPEVTR